MTYMGKFYNACRVVVVIFINILVPRKTMPFLLSTAISSLRLKNGFTSSSVYNHRTQCNDILYCNKIYL